MKDVLEELAIKKAKLEQEFIGLPETIISGVVGLNGPGAGKMPSDQLWSLHLSLIAWKECGKEINNSEIFVSKNITDSELAEIQKLIKHESLVQLRVKLLSVSSFGDARARLVSILEMPVDSELNGVLEKYREPQEFRHPEFGVLVLNKSVNWFEGTVVWMDSTIKIHASADANGSPESSFITLDSLYKDKVNWSRKVTDYAVYNLLDLKNDSWLDEGQDDVTASEFIDTMKLEAITAYPDGSFEFSHDDGDLFFGHFIRISGSLINGLNGADI